MIKKMFIISVLLIFLFLNYQQYLFSVDKISLDNIIKDIIKKYSLTEDQFLLFINSFEKLPFFYPLKDNPGEILQKFGMYVNKNHETLDMCTGIIIKAKKNSQVVSTADGKIKEIIKNENNDIEEYGASIYEAYDYRIVIEHEYGYISVYSNLKNIFVKKDEKVKKGQVIGEIKENDKLNIAYLFYQVRNWERMYNPKEYMLLAE